MKKQNKNHRLKSGPGMFSIPSRWFLDIYFKASSSRMTGKEIFRTIIHWDQRKGVTWKMS